MNRTMIRTVVLALGCLALLSCRPQYSFFFSGYVYDGISGARIENFTMTVSYADDTLKAKVTGGRFLVGPLPMQRDYTVRLEAAGYKTLVSQNQGLAGSQFGGSSTAGPEYVYREATLFPDGAVAPASRIRVTLEDSNVAPSGQAQLRPLGNVSNLDDATAQISNRRWLNTEVFQTASVIIAFSNGVIEIPEGAVTLGLNYGLSIFGVAGYQLEDGAFNFVAGTQSETIVALTRLDASTALKLVDASNRTSAVNAAGSLVLTYNQEIELDPRRTQATWNDLIDANITALQNDGVTAPVLKDATPPSNERGVSVAVSGNTVTFTVAPNPANILLNPIAPPAFLHMISYPIAGSGPLIRRKGTDDAFVQLNAVTSGSFTLSGDVVVQAR